MSSSGQFLFGGVNVKDEVYLGLFLVLRSLWTACETSTCLFLRGWGQAFSQSGHRFLNVLEVPTSVFFKEKDCAVSAILLDTTKTLRFPQQHHNPSISLVPVSPFSGGWMLVVYVKCFSNFACADECLYEKNWDRTGSLRAKKDDAVMLVFTQMLEVVFIHIT